MQKSKSTLATLKLLILTNDPQVVGSEGLIMKRSAYVFKQDGIFKYGIEVGQKRVSFHLMPMYANPTIRDRYVKRMKSYSFAKGCLRIKNGDELNIEELGNLISDCAATKFPCK